MHVLQGPVTAFAVLLAVGGGSKIRRPDSAMRGLRALRLPGGRTMVRVLAVCESAIGVGAIVFGNRLTSLLVAISYLGFACFVVLAKAKGAALTSCGCFGEPDTPPTSTHLVVTLAAATVASAAVVQPIGPLFSGLSSQPVGGAPFLFLTGCCVWFGYAALALLPKATTLVRPR